MVAAIEIYPPCFSLQVAGAARCAFPEFFRLRQKSRNASNDAGPKERAAIYRAALRSVCQWQKACFHRFLRFFLVFIWKTRFLRVFLAAEARGGAFGAGQRVVTAGMGR
jgi:hypothetical protein